MPSKSPAQARLMAAIAHGAAPKGGNGPSREVAKEYHNADKNKRLKKAMSKSNADPGDHEYR